MTQEELDQLALEVVNKYDQKEIYFPYRNDAVELMRRYRVALLEKMEPIGYFTKYSPDSPWEEVDVPEDGVPLYSLEEWKYK